MTRIGPVDLHLPTCARHECPSCVVMQPPGSSLCGPACVATVARVPLEDAARACGRRGATTTAHVRQGLAAYGYTLGPRQPAPYGVLPPPLPGIVGHLLRLNWGVPRPTHWALAVDGHVLDPWYGVDPHWPPQRRLWPPRTRVVSSYAITRG